MILTAVSAVYLPNRFCDIVRKGVPNLINERNALLLLRMDGIGELQADLLSNAIKCDCCGAERNREVIFQGDDQVISST